MQRFLGSVEAAEQHLPRWGEDKFARTYCAIERNYIKGSTVVTACKAGPADVVEEGGGPTGPQRIGIVERSVRGAGGNAMVISVRLLHDPLVKSVVRIVAELSHEPRHWMGRAVVQLKSSDKSLGWLHEQIGGEFMKSQAAVIARMANTATLEKCGFVLDNRVYVMSDDEKALATAAQDELADFFGQCCFCLARHRIRRDTLAFAPPPFFGVSSAFFV